MIRAALLLLALSATATARAVEPAGGPRPLRVTVFVLPHPGLDEATLAPLEHALADGLKRDPRLDMKELDSRLADFAQEIPEAQIADGRQKLKEGQAALTALELTTAIRTLGQAVDELAQVLPYIKKQELADAMMALGAAQLEEGDKRAARATFARLLTWRGDYQADPQRYAPAIAAVVEETRKELDKAHRGSLELRSEPPGAQAYVDGRFVGATPTFAEGLLVGEHWVTLKKEGYRRVVAPAQVSAKVQQLVELALVRSPSALRVTQALAATEPALGARALPAAADPLRAILFLDHAVFLRARPAGGALAVELFLYDLRNRRRLGQLTRTVPLHGDQELGGLAAALYRDVGDEPDGAVADGARRRDHARIYRSWWLWSAAGAVTAGVLLGAILGARAAGRSCPAGALCVGVSY